MLRRFAITIPQRDGGPHVEKEIMLNLNHIVSISEFVKPDGIKECRIRMTNEREYLSTVEYKFLFEALDGVKF